MCTDQKQLQIAVASAEACCLQTQAGKMEGNSTAAVFLIIIANVAPGHFVHCQQIDQTNKPEGG